MERVCTHNTTAYLMLVDLVFFFNLFRAILHTCFNEGKVRIQKKMVQRAGGGTTN